MPFSAGNRASSSSTVGWGGSPTMTDGMPAFTLLLDRGTNLAPRGERPRLPELPRKLLERTTFTDKPSSDSISERLVTRLAGGATPNAWHNSSNSGLGPCSQNIIEERVAKREFAWVVPYVKAHSVHRVGEPDTGVRVGEPERAPGSRRPKRLLRGTEYPRRERRDEAKRVCRVDMQYIVAQ